MVIIPEGSGITMDDVQWYMEKFQCTDEIALGSLLMWEKGEGEMPLAAQEVMPTLAFRWNNLREAKEFAAKEVPPEAPEVPKNM